MQTSETKLNEKSEVHSDDVQPDDHQQPSRDLAELACRLKNAVFSKFVSDYLISKTDEMWLVYEKRIDRMLRDKHFDMTCNHPRAQTSMQLEAIAKEQQEAICVCQRDIELLCSSGHKRSQNEEKQSIRLQATQRTASSSNSFRVPKIPRCIDRYKLANHIDMIDIRHSKKNKQAPVLPM